MTKAQVQKFIKENGYTKFDGYTKATINGIEVEMEKSVIAVNVDGEYWKLPTFTHVDFDGRDLVFTRKTKNGGEYMNMFFPSHRENKVVDAYFKVIEAIKF